MDTIIPLFPYAFPFAGPFPSLPINVDALELDFDAYSADLTISLNSKLIYQTVY